MCFRVVRDYITHYTPRNLVQGGLIPEMIQVYEYYILIVLIELNTLIYVRPLKYMCVS